MILVDIDDLTVTRPERDLLRNVSFTISAGDRMGIVGINGTGKSTLLRIISGEDEPDKGVVRRGKDHTVSVLQQDPQLPPGTVKEAIGPGWEVEAVVDKLGMGNHLESDTSTLSGGEAKRVALAMTLVSNADLLIMDEPTNHLDIGAIRWLEDRLAQHKGGLVLVTHDRHLLDRVANRVVELDRGQAYTHQGGYAAYLQGRADREAREAVTEHKRRQLAKKELAWLRRGAPARTSKSKARIATATALVEHKADAPARKDDLDLHVDVPRLGDKVVELHGIGHTHDGRELFSGLDLMIDRRERLGIVGLNGTGKSTLLDIISGRRQATEGEVVLGTTVHLGYHDQMGVELDPKQRVREAITGGKPKPDWQDVKLMESFWFDEDAQWAPIGLLSGGERRRLQLVLTLTKKPNVLLMDEPTNDLDLDTLRALEEFLDGWPGALLVVSHDRAFLERTVDDVLVLDGKGTAARYPGGYAAWEDTIGARAKPKDAKTGSKSKSSKPGQSVTKKSGGRSASTIRHELKAADKALAKLTKRRDALTVDLEAAGTDGKKIQAIGAELAEVQTELDRVEESWLSLSEELEDR